MHTPRLGPQLSQPRENLVLHLSDPGRSQGPPIYHLHIGGLEIDAEWGACEITFLF
jgi:hypothetical protein